MEKVIPAMRIHQSNYEFIKECAIQNSNGKISTEIRRMLKYVDMHRIDYSKKLSLVNNLLESDRKSINKDKRLKKLKEQKEKIEMELLEYEDIESKEIL